MNMKIDEVRIVCCTDFSEMVELNTANSKNLVPEWCLQNHKSTRIIRMPKSKD